MKKVLVVTAAAATILLACGEEEGITAAPYEYEPVDVLENVATSIDEGDINLLRSCLDPAFVFYFDPRDVGQTPPGKSYIIPGSWSYTEFWATLYNMFGRAYYVGFNIYAGRVGAPGEKETRYEAGEVRVYLVVMVDERSGYTAEGGYCDFAFESYYNGKGEKLWRLAEWRDFTSVYADAAPGVEPASLGMVLAMYK